tara:strand:- start:6968 stop:7792 length:825 start_codon:yes stop_codon:yes gene_type:complete
MPPEGDEGVDAPDVEADDPDSQAGAAEPVAESGALSMEQQDRVRGMIQQRDTQWQQWAADKVRQTQQTQQAPANAAPVTDEVGDDLRALYTDDDVGQKTFDTIEKHIRKRIGPGQQRPPTRAEIAAIARGESDKVRNQVQSGVTVTNEVNNLVQRGVISGGTEKSLVEQEYTSRLANPQVATAAQTPGGAEMILKTVVYDLISDGKIKPGSKPKQPSGSPLQPGGNGSPAPGAPDLASLDKSKSPFASVRAMSDADVKENRAVSAGNFGRASNG